jgi:hypothetical protein
MEKISIQTFVSKVEANVSARFFGKLPNLPGALECRYSIIFPHDENQFQYHH